MRYGWAILASSFALVLACSNDDSSSPPPAADAGPSSDASTPPPPPDGGPTDASTCTSPTSSDPGTKGAIAIASDPGGAPAGLGDPSILYPAGATAGFLSYTAVGIGTAHTRLATSTDKGATWSYVGEVNAPEPISITTNDNAVCGAATCNGKWIHETSSLVDDAADPVPARRFKVFTHSYFSTAADALHYEIGSITMWTTAALQAGATWTSTRVLGWTSSSPSSSTNVTSNVTTDPKLAPVLGSCVALTEPGAMVRGGTIDLALGCVRYVSASDIPIEVVLVRSTDHGQTWSAVGKLLDAADAKALGATGTKGAQMNAPSLVTIGGKPYLLATPSGAVTNMPSPDGYRGCHLFPFADLDKGQLERCGGVPVVTRSIVGPAGLFHGACAYDEGASAAGVLYLSATTARNPPFQFFPTGIALP